MIVPMKKIHVIVQKKDITPALESLRDLGSVHVEHQEALSGYQLEERREEVEVLTRAIHILKEFSPEGNTEFRETSDWREVVNTVLELSGEVDHYTGTIAKRQGQITQWEPWGDFDLQSIKALGQKGISVRLMEVPVGKKSNIPGHIVLEKIFSRGGTDYCVVLFKGKADLPFAVVPLPEQSLKEMWALQEQEQKKIADAQKKITEHVGYLSFLERTLLKCENILKFEEVQRGMKEEQELALLKGYCPEDACVELEKKSKAEGWGLLIEDPAADDRVPTLLRNPKWANLSKPALDMIEILPGYQERDVSAVFTVFFTLFFGMLIGDAAYGIIFACATFFAHRKLKNRVKDPTPFQLMYLLTGFTILWGVLTGTYFGQQWLPSPVRPLVPWLNDSLHIQWLCFTIALVHLSIARAWKVKIKFPDLTALSEVGWLLIIWGMYFLANMFVLNMPFPKFAGWFFAIGIPLALVFMVPLKEFTQKVPQEIIPFVLSVVAAGTDIISYIRLYAVGLATVAVADAANAMPAALPAFGLGYFFMIFLHILNMILATMAILVHGIRLNVLEFSGHLSLEWAGFKYSPFSKKLKNA